MRLTIRIKEEALLDLAFLLCLFKVFDVFHLAQVDKDFKGKEKKEKNIAINIYINSTARESKGIQIKKRPIKDQSLRSTISRSCNWSHSLANVTKV